LGAAALEIGMIFHLVQVDLAVLAAVDLAAAVQEDLGKVECSTYYVRR